MWCGCKVEWVALLEYGVDGWLRRLWDYLALLFLYGGVARDGLWPLCLDGEKVDIFHIYTITYHLSTRPAHLLTHTLTLFTPKDSHTHLLHPKRLTHSPTNTHTLTLFIPLLSCLFPLIPDASQYIRGSEAVRVIACQL